MEKICDATKLHSVPKFNGHRVEKDFQEQELFYVFHIFPTKRVRNLTEETNLNVIQCAKRHLDNNTNQIPEEVDSYNQTS